MPEFEASARFAVYQAHIVVYPLLLLTIACEDPRWSSVDARLLSLGFHERVVVSWATGGGVSTHYGDTADNHLRYY